jgi:VWFA-related protein
MARKSRAVRLLCCLCFAGFALNSPKLPRALAQSDSSFKVRVGVDLATVDVIVADKKGSPVHNLKKEDFQLYEDGKKQEIVSLDEVNAESESSSLGVSPIDEKPSHRGKTVLIVFNDSSIRPENIKKSRDSAQKFVKEHMRPQDLFAVAEFGMTMKVLQNFTKDREEVLGAIAHADPMNAGGGSMYFEDLLRSLDGIDLSIAPIKGQKTILIYSQQLGAPGNVGVSTSQRGSPGRQLSSPGYAGVSMGNAGVARVSGTLEDTYKKTLVSAKKSNVTLYVIDPDERNTTAPIGITLTSLASESGGSAINAHINDALDRLDQKISNYYILGFQSNNPRRDGAFRKLEIKTELKGVTLKHPAGYQDRRPIDVLASAKQEKTLLTALASSDIAAQLPIVFRPLYFYDSPRVVRVLVASRIRMEKAAFRKNGGQMGTEFNIMGVAYAEDGSIAARFSETLPISFDKEKETEFRKKDLVYRNYFKLRPGKYRLKLAVSDESDNLGSTEQMLQIPALPDRGFAGSSIAIAEQTSSLPDLIRNLQSQLLDEDDPLLCPGVQIEPSVRNRLPAGANVPLVFRIYSLPGPHDQWDLTAQVKLLDENGKEYKMRPISLKTATSPVGKAEALVTLTVSFKQVPTGKYRLIIETGESGTQDTATLQTDIEFTAPTN